MLTICAVLYFFYYTIFGGKGIVKYFQLEKELHKKELIKNDLQAIMKNKQNMVDGMNLKSLDLDLLDEQDRKNLGYVNKNEIVIYDDEEDKPNNNK